MQDLKMRDMKMRDQIAGVENAGKVSMESQSVKKCLKVVVFVCRVIPSVCGLKQQKGDVGSSSRECVCGSLRRKRRGRTIDVGSEVR